MYPHDNRAFTQGLVFDGGVLYEGTGLKGRSSLRRVDLDTGEALQVHELAPEFFGEGIAVYGANGDRIVQLTWQDHTGFVYEKGAFRLLRTFSYPTEGWGVTYDGTRLIMSDGTATLRFLDPDTLAETGSVQVRDENGPVVRLNELEYIGGSVYANIWQKDYIVMISPETGRVTGRADLAGLKSTGDVLNGIAYDPEGRRLFVTGKLWPSLFEIELVPRT